jgi:hypothetical protein
MNTMTQRVAEALTQVKGLISDPANHCQYAFGLDGSGFKGFTIEEAANPDFDGQICLAAAAKRVAGDDTALFDEMADEVRVADSGSMGGINAFCRANNDRDHAGLMAILDTAIGNAQSARAEVAAAA